MTTAELAQILGGEVVGRAVRAPSPGLPPDDRSLTVALIWGAPDGFLIRSRIVNRATARAHVIERMRTLEAKRARLPLFGGVR